VPHSHAAVARALEMVREHPGQILAQGSEATDEFLRPVMGAHGLRASRRLSHVLYVDVPSHRRPILISDMMVNIEPTLAHKADITQNAIDFAHMMGIGEPKVAVLAAIETIRPTMRATVDAAALCKMVDRGQITGGLIDGPLGFDNAVSIVSARTAGLSSAVAGHADVLIAPDLESGNMLAKQLEQLSDGVSGGVVVGGRSPIVLANRGDSVESRVASLALAVLVSRHVAAR
jgi:phosphotransacetylase